MKMALHLDQLHEKQVGKCRDDLKQCIYAFHFFQSDSINLLASN